MLKDLTKNDWLDILDLPAHRVPSLLVLRGTRNLRANYDKYRAHFDDVLEIGSPNGLFEDIFVGRRAGLDVAYASVYGAPMASEITHLCAVLGASLVVQTGVCGALGDDIAAGDLVIATEARCAEGTAESYLPGVPSVPATPELVTEIMTDPRVAVPRHAGPVWTTAALLAEGETEIAQWHGAGYIAADMETATTFAVAAYFTMRRVSLLYAFDNPRHGSHLGLTEAHKNEARAAGEQAMFALLFALIEHHAAARPAAPPAPAST